MTQSDTVTEVIDGRKAVYGDPVETFPRVAQIWSGILGTEVRADQVVLMLMGYKLARASECPEYSDNSDDVEGYLDIFRKVVGEDMIHARTVSDFLAEKERRARVAQAAEHRAQVPIHEPHSLTCMDWNDRWKDHWLFTCIEKLTSQQILAIERSRVETEVATPKEA